MVERRVHQRFHLDHGAIASLSYQLTVLGKIFNISEAGLAFSYVASHKRSHESPFLDIVPVNGGPRLRKIPFTTVWDTPMFQEFSSGSISIRYCGVRFKHLTEKQAKDLKRLINACSGASCH